MTGLPQVQPAMRKAEFWLTLDDRLAEPQDAEIGQRSVQTGLFDMRRESRFNPEMPPAETPEGFTQDGVPWSAEAWMTVMDNIHRARPLSVRGVTVKRANVRRWPTASAYFRTANDREFDQFQETRLHLFEPVYVLGESQDQAWWWIRSRVVGGWIRRQHVALADEGTWTAVQDEARPRLLIAANGVTTEPQPYDWAVSAKPLEFAAYLPLWPDVISVGGQTPAGHRVVGYPVRTADGGLDARPALVKDTDQVHQGPLPCTRAEVIASAFRLLGDRYAWGDKLGTHDCSSLVMDAYRTVGIQLPRNSAVQARGLPAVTVWREGTPYARRVEDLRTLARPGDLLMMPGHVMMYLGVWDDTAYAIHAFVGYAERIGGHLYTFAVNSVEVSSLATLTRDGTIYLEACTRVVRVL